MLSITLQGFLREVVMHEESAEDGLFTSVSVFPVWVCFAVWMSVFVCV